MPRRASVIVVAVLALALAGVACADDAPPDQTKVSARLTKVRHQIDALAKAQRRAGNARDALADKLATQADALSAASRAAAASQAAVAAQRAKVAALETQRDAAEARLAAQRGALAELLRAAYTLGRGSDLKVLLGELARCPATATNADCPADKLARIRRALAYSRYFQRDRVKRIDAIGHDLQLLDASRKRLVAQQAALDRALTSQRAEVAALQRARAEQQRLLAAADAKIHDRAAQLKQLAHEEQSLRGVLERLRDVFADIPRKLSNELPFAKRRGDLPWPAHGNARSFNHGLLIDAKPGTKVHAVAHGRVAYAAWLRGFGMLLILDHGDGWMSLYGGNERLLREVGEWVNAGDVIATSGRIENGGNGVYFGLRHSGKAIDPRPWLRAAH